MAAAVGRAAQAQRALHLCLQGLRRCTMASFQAAASEGTWSPRLSRGAWFLFQEQALWELWVGCQIRESKEAQPTGLLRRHWPGKELVWTLGPRPVRARRRAKD